MHVNVCSLELSEDAILRMINICGPKRCSSSTIVLSIELLMAVGGGLSIGESWPVGVGAGRYDQHKKLITIETEQYGSVDENKVPDFPSPAPFRVCFRVPQSAWCSD